MYVGMYVLTPGEGGGKNDATQEVVLIIYIYTHLENPDEKKVLSKMKKGTLYYFRTNIFACKKF